MRAAAFSFGVLKEFAQGERLGARRRVPLIDHIDFVTGVSGGAVPAAYFGLKRRAALEDFRERFLIRDAEESLNTAVSLGNISRAISGGVNEDTRFRSWLDANLFEGATFSALLTERRPRIWINATDIYNGTPFVFGKTAFSAICSDLANYPIASAVAASAAVPLVFAPIVLEAFPDRCNPAAPAWIEKARDNPNAPPLLRAFAQGIGRYRDGTVKYIKLLDGGLVDNFGLSGFTIGRESSEVPYGPLTQPQAARAPPRAVPDRGRRAGAAGRLGAPARRPERRRPVQCGHRRRALCQRARELHGVPGDDGKLAHRVGALALRTAAGPSAEAARRRPADCRDLKIYVGRIGFDQLEPERAAQLGAIETRFKLPVETVDELIAAGGEALAAIRPIGRFSRGCERPHHWRPQRIATCQSLQAASAYHPAQALRHQAGWPSSDALEVLCVFCDLRPFHAKVRSISQHRWRQYEVAGPPGSGGDLEVAATGGRERLHIFLSRYTRPASTSLNPGKVRRNAARIAHPRLGCPQFRRDAPEAQAAGPACVATSRCRFSPSRPRQLARSTALCRHDARAGDDAVYRNAIAAPPRSAPVAAARPDPAPRPLIAPDRSNFARSCAAGTPATGRAKAAARQHIQDLR